MADSLRPATYQLTPDGLRGLRQKAKAGVQRLFLVVPRCDLKASGAIDRCLWAVL